MTEPNFPELTGPFESAARVPPGERFAAGTLLARRYRIVALLGKGGMGEVYRADDLTLGQAVALKFLPAHLTRDPDRLARFRKEVATARTVSHPHVCRVYDLAEADGQPFLTMEFIDGEDLASVLRRFGRLPEERAVGVARQLCAALAAVHDLGLLHRDLKPHNVMLDGRGQVRLTDFGLAAAAQDLSATEVRAGTPLYMAPEQLAGQEVSVQSDLFALGLVLYELFLGRKAFPAATREELARKYADNAPSKPSDHVSGLSPAVERVVLRCLGREPKNRPRSAHEVLAALPGGDPLAAALAAGETPSPALVAAAGDAGGLSPVTATVCLAAVLLGLGAVLVLARWTSLVNRVPLEKPPQVLEDQARTITRALGYAGPRDRDHGFAVDEDYLRYWKAHDPTTARWDRLAEGHPPAVYFWYRQSTQPLVSSQSLLHRGGQVAADLLTPYDPPPTFAGMVGVKLTPDGRLLEFQATSPPGGRTPQPPTTPEQARAGMEHLLKLADFDPADFVLHDEATWVPPVFADRRLTGRPRPGSPGEKAGLRVVAAFDRGEPVSFQVLWPWTPAARPEQVPDFEGESLGRYVMDVTQTLALLVGGLLLAVRNLRLGRGDRTGAFRLALFTFALTLATWVLQAHHVLSWAEYDLCVRGVAWALLAAVEFWLLYVGLEPAVRRFWPEALIGWNRLLAGRFRDPRVGRDLLAGVLAGVLFTLLGQALQLTPLAFGRPPQTPDALALDLVGGGRLALANVLLYLLAACRVGLFHVLVFFVLLRLLTRSTWWAAGLWVVFVLIFFSLWRDDALVSALLYLPGFVLMALVLIRFGLVAVIALWFVQSLLRGPLTPDLSAWYAGTGLQILGATVLLAGYGTFTALGGKPLFGKGFFAED